MMIPGMNMNPKQMQGMMRQLGIKQEELNAKRVIFEMDGKKLVIEHPQVSAMDMKGQKIYTVTGIAKEEEGEAHIPDEDVELVAEQTGKSQKEARKALIENNEDIAKAISSLKD